MRGSMEIRCVEWRGEKLILINVPLSSGLLHIFILLA